MVSVALSATFAVFFWEALVTSANEITNDICPGSRLDLKCFEDPRVSTIQWEIWCDCGGDSSESCCNPTTATEILNTASEIRLGSLSCNTDNNSSLTYELNVINNTVSFSLLRISVSKEQNSTRLCLLCRPQPPTYIQILGPPPLPQDFKYHPDYTMATDVDVEVNFTWSSPQLNNNNNNNNLTVYYGITINEASESTGTTSYTSTTSFTARLRSNTTYSVAVYASRCNGTLISDSVTSNITLRINSTEVAEINTSEKTIIEENAARVPEIVSSVVGGVVGMLLTVCLLGCFICLARKCCARKLKLQRSACTTDGQYSSDREVCTDSIYNVLSHEKSKLKALCKREQQHIVHQGQKDPSTQEQARESINVGVPEGNYTMITLENIEQERNAEVAPISTLYSEEYSQINHKAGKESKIKYAELAIPNSEECSRINQKAGNHTEYSEIGNLHYGSEKAMDTKSDIDRSNSTALEPKNTVLGLKDVVAHDENTSAHSDNENGDATDSDDIPPPIPPQLF